MKAETARGDMPVPLAFIGGPLPPVKKVSTPALSLQRAPGYNEVSAFDF